MYTCIILLSFNKPLTSEELHLIYYSSLILRPLLFFLSSRFFFTSLTPARFWLPSNNQFSLPHPRSTLYVARTAYIVFKRRRLTPVAVVGGPPKSRRKLLSAYLIQSRTTTTTTTTSMTPYNIWRRSSSRRRRYTTQTTPLRRSPSPSPSPPPPRFLQPSPPPPSLILCGCTRRLFYHNATSPPVTFQGLLRRAVRYIRSGLTDAHCVFPIVFLGHVPGE